MRPVNDETKELVGLLTCEKTNEENREKIVSAYYMAIAKNPKAALIKCMDRCNSDDLNGGYIMKPLEFDLSC